MASLVAQRLKRLPTMRETWVRSLGREDPLEKEMVTTPVFLPGESHGQRSLVGYSPRGRTISDRAEETFERLRYFLGGDRPSQTAHLQIVKRLPTMQETWVRSLGWEDPLKEGMATHPSILAWRIPVDRGA